MMRRPRTRPALEAELRGLVPGELVLLEVPNLTAAGSSPYRTDVGERALLGVWQGLAHRGTGTSPAPVAVVRAGVWGLIVVPVSVITGVRYLEREELDREQLGRRLADRRRTHGTEHAAAVAVVDAWALRLLDEERAAR